MNLNMKINGFCVFLFFVLLFWACAGEKKTEPEQMSLKNIPVGSKEITLMDYSGPDFRLQEIFVHDEGSISPEDSVKITNILAYFVGIDKDRELPSVQYRSNTDSVSRFINLTFNGGQIIRGIYSEKSEILEMRERFYFKDGELVCYRRRRWDKIPGAGVAGEKYGFFENQKVFKILEYSGKVGEGEVPGQLIGTPLSNSDEDLMERQNKIEQEWDRIMTLAIESEQKESQSESPVR